jgi:deazaflavin-dependent oxidoreductase (nitroreductase family)
MRRTGKALLLILGIIVIEEIVSTALMIWAFRTRNPRALRLVRQYNKYVTNPVMLRFSGRSAHSGTLHHVGRRSGTPRATPLTVHRSDGDMVIPLPYGTEVDWLRNLLAAGHAEIDLEGRTFTVDEPRVVDIDEVVGVLPASLVRLVRMHDTRQAVRMRVPEFATSETV